MPCKIFPQMDEAQLDSLASAAEAKFYRACRDRLDPSCLVIHSLSLITASPSLGNQVSECDFLIIHPEFGILGVEVKGGGIEFDPAFDGKWYSTNRDGRRIPIKNPFQQSVNAAYKALDLIKSARGVANKKIALGHTVAFPDISHSQMNTIVSHDRPRDIIACSEDLQDLQDWYTKATRFWIGKESNFDNLQKVDMQEIERLLLKPVFAKSSTAQQLQKEEEKRIRLTEEQLALVRFLQHQKKANIVGGAGTGKTVLAIHLAQSFAAEGKRTLLLCFNRALGDNLSILTGGTSNLEAGSFHSFFQRKMSDEFELYYDQAMKNLPGDDPWGVIRPYAYTLYLEEISLRYEAVIIDEAQDFVVEAWMPIETLLSSKDDIFFTFSDNNQRFYSKVDHIPRLSEPYPLSQNCRNTRFIHETAYTNYKGPTVNPPSIDGAPVKEHSSDLEKEQLEVLGQLLHELITDGGLKPHDLTVLIAGSTELNHKAILLQKSIKKFDFIVSEVITNNKIRISSVKRFKGLEASVLLIWGLNDVSQFERDELHYVSISRAKSLCYLIN